MKNGVDSAGAATRIGEMEDAFPEAAITGYDVLIPSMRNREKDRHVLAAAVRAGAEVIVTANVRDFPMDALGPLGIVAKHPDEFLMDLLGFDAKEVLDTVRAIADQKTRPPMTAFDILRRVGKSSPNFAAAAIMMLEERSDRRTS